MFVPAANLLVQVAKSADALILHKMDVDAALEKSGVDYLFVTSRPPLTIKARTKLSYQLQVKSKRGGVKHKLEAGPEGMTLSPAGLLEWAPTTPSGEQTVIISIGDSSGQEIFHTFKVSVSN